ncbi:SPOR domain-containing protein [Sphingosinicella sp. LHD-64]|uniref:SPOR domain-containing protein n=1 Tax=Sphingosinicella sp. LHD-64 TaxID=3072139 RepID=UPI00280D05B3|nr:SPOR domain-containing protein [Sphingosinicella sp. LHD-64]MDQ8758225.1 SPOR domain-containing protein [Sphingosinicella sp. LHD-64]
MPRRRGDETESDATPFDQDEVVDFSAGAPDEDRLPWLEAVEEDEGSAGPGIAKLVGAVVIGLLAIGLIVGGLFWLGNRGREGGTGDLIAAPEGDYKVRPDEPGGMNVAGEGDTAYAASAGQVPQGQLNTNAVAETPVARPAPQPAPQQQAEAQRPQAPAPQPQRPAPAATGGGATIQLGAFSTGASANSAWTALSGRFRYLAPLSRSVIPVQSGGRTLYRLRASGPGAADVCRRLRVAGEACTVVG